jgi:hypothetical protein
VNIKSSKLSTIITLIGAGVVLATFVVKDVMNEKLKNVTDSLSSAQTFYFTQTYNIFGQDDLAYVKQQVDLTLNAVRNPGKDQLAANEQVIRVRAQASDDHLAVMTEYLQNLVQLVDKIPQEKDNADKVSMVRSECAQNVAELKALEGQMEGIFSAINKNPNDPAAIAKLKIFVDQTGAISKNTSMITDAAKNLTSKVVSDLVAKKQRSEQDYSRTTTLSYVLFALGWVTSLVGQLLAIGGQSEL